MRSFAQQILYSLLHLLEARLKADQVVKLSFSFLYFIGVRRRSVWCGCEILFEMWKLNICQWLIIRAEKTDLVYVKFGQCESG